MEMGSAKLAATAHASSVTLALPARTTAQMLATIKGSAPTESASAWQAGLEMIALSSFAAVATEIAQCLTHVCANQAGLGTSVGYVCNAQIRAAVATGNVLQVFVVSAMVDGWVMHVKCPPQIAVDPALLAVRVTQPWAYAWMGRAHHALV
jgi:hypothetical protein